MMWRKICRARSSRWMISRCGTTVPDIPVFAWMLNDKPDRKWNLYDLQDRLRMKGWLVPAYPMPVDLTQVTVQRIVVRNGFSHDMAEAFIKDLKSCVKYLDGLRSPMPRGSCIRIPPLIFRGHSTNSIVSRIKEIHVHSHNDYVYESWLQ